MTGLQTSFTLQLLCFAGLLNLCLAVQGIQQQADLEAEQVPNDDDTVSYRRSSSLGVQPDGSIRKSIIRRALPERKLVELQVFEKDSPTETHEDQDTGSDSRDMTSDDDTGSGADASAGVDTVSRSDEEDALAAGSRPSDAADASTVADRRDFQAEAEHVQNMRPDEEEISAADESSSADAVAAAEESVDSEGPNSHLPPGDQQHEELGEGSSEADNQQTGSLTEEDPPEPASEDEAVDKISDDKDPASKPEEEEPASKPEAANKSVSKAAGDTKSGNTTEEKKTKPLRPPVDNPLCIHFPGYKLKAPKGQAGKIHGDAKTWDACLTKCKAPDTKPSLADVAGNADSVCKQVQWEDNAAKKVTKCTTFNGFAVEEDIATIQEGVAYTAAICNPPAGSSGDRGPRGPAGPQGPRGPQGAAGQQGEAGPDGSPGEVGANGEKGDAGPDGLDGEEADSDGFASMGMVGGALVLSMIATAGTYAASKQKVEKARAEAEAAEPVQEENEEEEQEEFGEEEGDEEEEGAGEAEAAGEEANA